MQSSDEEEEEEEVIYVDEDGNPVDPEEGEIVEEEVIYVDEFGNPVEIDSEDEVSNTSVKETKHQKPERFKENTFEKQKKNMNHMSMQETAIQAKVQEVVEQLNQRRKKDMKKYRGVPSYLKKTKSQQQHLVKSVPPQNPSKQHKPVKKMSLSESQQIWEAHAKKRQELRKMAYQNMQSKKEQSIEQEKAERKRQIEDAQRVRLQQMQETERYWQKIRPSSAPVNVDDHRKMLLQHLAPAMEDRIKVHRAECIRKIQRRKAWELGLKTSVGEIKKVYEATMLKKDPGNEEQIDKTVQHLQFLDEIREHQDSQITSSLSTPSSPSPYFSWDLNKSFSEFHNRPLFTSLSPHSPTQATSPTTTYKASPNFNNPVPKLQSPPKKQLTTISQSKPGTHPVNPISTMDVQQMKRQLEEIERIQKSISIQSEPPMADQPGAADVEEKTSDDDADSFNSDDSFESNSSSSEQVETLLKNSQSNGNHKDSVNLDPKMIEDNVTAKLSKMIEQRKKEQSLMN